MNELLTTVFWSTVTLAVFFGWRRIFLALKHPLLHPILWATLAVVLLLAFSRYPVIAYREKSAPLVWLLGPAVVAMAVPIWQRRKLIVSNWRALLLVVALGIAFSAFSVLLLGPFLGWREAKSLVPKSVTAPVALGIIREGSLGRAPQDQLIESQLALGIMVSALSGAVLGPVGRCWRQRSRLDGLCSLEHSDGVALDPKELQNLLDELAASERLVGALGRSCRSCGRS